LLTQLDLNLASKSKTVNSTKKFYTIFNQEGSGKSSPVPGSDSDIDPSFTVVSKEETLQQLHQEQLKEQQLKEEQLQESEVDVESFDVVSLSDVTLVPTLKNVFLCDVSAT
jgi:hypothetical protein